MNRSTVLRVFVICLAALAGAGVASARSGRTAANTPTLRPAGIAALSLAMNTGSSATAIALPAPWMASTGQLLDDDKDNDKDDNGGDGNWDHHDGRDHHRRDKDDPAPAPMPEPSTFMSLGVALVIGGGVYFLGRLRNERK